MTQAHINRIGTAVPRHEVHDAFRIFAGRQITDARTRTAFARLAERSQISHRRSVLEPDAEAALAALGLDLPGLGASLLPFAARALPRRQLDGALREAAVAAGVELRCGVTVCGAGPIGDAWRLHLPNGSIAVRRIVLATGKHGCAATREKARRWGAVGQKLHLTGGD